MIPTHTTHIHPPHTTHTGVRGDVDTSEEARLQQVKDKLQEKQVHVTQLLKELYIFPFVKYEHFKLCTSIIQVSLETGPSHIASEYYTSEEMVKFKKPKKKRKVRKKLKADDILPLGDVGTKDHGSRRYCTLCVVWRWLFPFLNATHFPLLQYNV